MGFEITSYNLSKRMYPGMIISYVVKPFAGIKTIWVTEITQVKDQQYFVDEQRLGPYRLWHHQHLLESVGDEKTRMIDRVNYRLPFGVIGTLVHELWVKKMLNDIFAYRAERLLQIFV